MRRACPGDALAWAASRASPGQGGAATQGGGVQGGGTVPAYLRQPGIEEGLWHSFPGPGRAGRLTVALLPPTPSLPHIPLPGRVWQMRAAEDPRRVPPPLFAGDAEDPRRVPGAAGDPAPAMHTAAGAAGAAGAAVLHFGFVDLRRARLKNAVYNMLDAVRRGRRAACTPSW